jgi:methionyl-tRNA synthetase
MDSGKFYITTPIYYVNDKPHIGHAYTTILADVLSRYHRLTGTTTFFLTGTDEHGQKVQDAAAAMGIKPQEHADKMVVRFQELWKRLDITNDDFIRTTDERHTRIVQRILQDLFDRDEIYKADYDGWYCVTCERFYTEKDLVDGSCPQDGCGRPVERIRESNYFFRMSKYQDWLIDTITSNPEFIQPDFRRNETLGFLRQPLNDLCISRPKSRLSWGIEIPFDTDFVTYVWFDALVNYVSAIGYLTEDTAFKRWWPASCHLIGKDILTTHTVYWPTMLKAMGLPMPETIFAHGWWLIGRDKMSKTTGNVVDPMDIADQYGVDAFRYFLMSEMTLGQDACFTQDAFVRRYNSDLANDLGNLLSRVLKLLASHCKGIIPSPGEPGIEEKHLRDVSIGAACAMVDLVGKMKLDQGLAGLTGVVREGNRYLEKKQPWTLIKEGKRSEFETVMYYAAEALRVISGMLHPVMPGKMNELRKTIGFGDADPEMATLTTWGTLKPGTRVNSGKILFPRIREKSSEADQEIEGVMKIEYTDFEKVQLRTARIVDAEKVEKTDKLLQLQVEIGDEQRQIVAGIAQHYEPGDLPGKTIVIVANLKPAKIRGIESDGMLLAAWGQDGLKLVTVEGGVESGVDVK